MYRHTPSRLRGPLSRSRAWWKFPAPENNKADRGARRRRAVPVAQEIRTELVSRVRQEIAEGRYDTPEKWDAALERLLARVDMP
jgi:hypothetical protein